MTTNIVSPITYSAWYFERINKLSNYPKFKHTSLWTFFMIYSILASHTKNILSANDSDSHPIEMQDGSNILAEDKIIPGSVKVNLRLSLHSEDAGSFHAILILSFDSPQAVDTVDLSYDPSAIHMLPLFVCDSTDIPCNEWVNHSDTLLRIKVIPVKQQNGNYKYTIKLNYHIKIFDARGSSGFYKSLDSQTNLTYISTNLKHKYGNRQAIPFFIDSSITTSVKLIVSVPPPLQVISNTLLIQSANTLNPALKEFEETPQMLLDHFVMTIGRFQIEKVKYEDRVSVQIATLRTLGPVSQAVLSSALKSIQYFENKFATNFPLKQLTLFIAGSSNCCNSFGWGHATLEMEGPSEEQSQNEYELFRARCVIRIVASQWIGTLVAFKQFNNTWPDEALVEFLFTNEAMAKLYSSENRNIRLFSRYQRLKQYIDNILEDISETRPQIEDDCDLECRATVLGRPSRMAEMFYTLKKFFAKGLWHFFSDLLEKQAYKVISFRQLVDSLKAFLDNIERLSPEDIQAAKLELDSVLGTFGVNQLDVKHEVHLDETFGFSYFITVTQTAIERAGTLNATYKVPINLLFTFGEEESSRVEYITIFLASQLDSFTIGTMNGLVAGIYASADASFYYLPGSILNEMVEISANQWFEPVLLNELEGIVSLLPVSILRKTISVGQAVTFMDGLFNHIAATKDINQFLTASGIAVLKGIIDLFWEEKRSIDILTKEQNKKKLETQFFRKAGWRFMYLQENLAGFFGTDFGVDLEARILQERLRKNIDEVIKTIGSSVPRKRRKRKVKIESMRNGIIGL